MVVSMAAFTLRPVRTITLVVVVVFVDMNNTERVSFPWYVFTYPDLHHFSYSINSEPRTIAPVVDIQTLS
jgi:hypothetical protein